MSSRTSAKPPPTPSRPSSPDKAQVEIPSAAVQTGKLIEMVSPSSPLLAPAALVPPPPFSHSSSPPASTTSTPSSRRSSRTSSSEWRQRWLLFRGPALVLVSEMFGGAMAATTRLLEMPSAEGEPGMHTLQILFVRFSITLVLSTLYMGWKGVEDFPLGKSDVRPALVARGACGFMGVFGFYYSLQYLPMAEAIIISFITPVLASYFSSVFLNEFFSKKQLIAGLICFIGIIIVADPFSFSKPPQTTTPDSEQSARGDKSVFGNDVTPFQRFTAITFALISDFAAAGAYTFIRVIGTRAHALISVNYYALLTTILSFFLLVLPIFPDVGFRFPHGLREWLLLVGIGVFGFLLQFLLTAALVMDKSPRATNMMYSQIIFALLLDWGIWGVLPGTMTWIGGGIVVAGVIWGTLVKEDANKPADEEYCAIPQEEEEEEEEGEGEGNEAEDQAAGGYGGQDSDDDMEGLPKL